MRCFRRVFLVPFLTIVTASSLANAVPAEAAEQERPRLTTSQAESASTAGPGAPHKRSSQTVSVGEQGESALAATVATETLTFSEFPEDTPIATQYRPRGVDFGGDNPFITGDSAHVTTPVLSGSPRFSGAINGTFVLPDGQAGFVSNFSLDVGYIDDPGSVEVLVYDGDGVVIKQVAADSLGIVNIEVTAQGIAGFRVQRISAESAGFSIDNVSFSTPEPSPGPVPIPLAQTFGFGCNCNGAPLGYQHLTALPVNTASGALTEMFTDVEFPGAGVPLVFSRAYTSLDTTTGPMGPGWTHAFNASAAVAPSGDVTVRAEDGQQVRYTRLGDGSFAAPPGAGSTLEATPTGYRLTKPDQSRLDFDSAGRLTAVASRVGVGLTLGYDGEELSTITDAAGRVVTLSYNGPGLLTSVALPDGRHVDYGYTHSRLTTVTDLRGKVTTYGYDAGDRLVSARDPLGHDLFRNTYDSTTGRVVEQLDARGKKTTFSWDPATGTSTRTDPGGGQWVEVYTGNVLTQSTDPLDNTVRYAYDLKNNLRGITDARGNITRMTYDPRGNMLTRTAPEPLSYQESWTYNAAGDVLTYTDGRGNTVTNEYDPTTGLPVKTTDAEGGATTYTYSPSGQISTITDPRGNATTFGYDADGNPDSVTAPSGAATTVDFDAAGRLISVVDPRGNTIGGIPADFTSTFTYNDGDLITASTDARGNRTTFAHDDAGRLTTSTDPLLKPTTYTYDEANHLTTVTDPAGAVTSNTYDDTGNLTSTTTPAGTTTHSYDLAGQRTQTVDPRGNVTGADPAPYTWQFTYDAAGNRTEVSNPAAGLTVTGYDELNRPTQVTDPLGHTTTTGYDPNSNITTVTDPSNRTDTFTYDKASRLLTSTDAGGNTASFGYDAAGNRTSHTTPLGNKTTWTYDPDGRIASMVNPRGNVTGGTPANYTTGYDYDAAGNLTQETDPLGNATAYAYDPAGNLLTRRDANNHTTAYTYDELNRLASVTASGTTQPTDYAYDDAGNLTTRTDPLGRVTTYGYDPARRLTRLTSPMGQRWDYDYDPAGNLTKVVDANGNATTAPDDGVTSYGYDSRNLATSVDYSSGDLSDVTYGYDAAGNRTTMSDRFGTETYDYDSRNLLTKVTRGTQSFLYTHTAVQQVSKTTYPDGTVVKNCYDDDSRLASVTEGTTGCPTTNTAATTSYTYDAAGALKTTTLPSGNGHVETRTYDRAQRVTRVKNAKGTAVLSDSQYTLDGVGNPTAMTVNDGTTTATTSYQYDTRDQLTEVCFKATCPAAGDPFIRYGYDAAGNRTTETRPAGTTTYTYNDADQLASQTGPDGASTYGYDDNGNLTYSSDLFDFAGDAYTFEYDQANRLVMATIKPGYYDERYRYDGDGKRVQTVDDFGKITNHQWDVIATLPRLVSENAENGSVVRRYIYGHNLISMDTLPTSKHFYHHDRIGSVLNLTGTDGTRRWTYTYEPFGEMRKSTRHTSSAKTNPMMFAGEHFDGHTGMYHLRARQYHPKTGRFTATDPLTPPITDPYVSAYVYVGNQPTLYTDPSGLCQASDTVGGALDFVGWDRDAFCDWGSDGATAVNELGGGMFGAVAPESASDWYNNHVGIDEDSGWYGAVQTGTTVASIATAAGSAIRVCRLAPQVIRNTPAALKNATTWLKNLRNPTAAAPTVAGPARSTDDLLRSFGSLSAGNQKHVRTVSSQAELRQTFEAWAVGAQRLQARGPKVPDVYRLPDGTVLQWRTGSKSGGSTIDIFTGDVRPRKVHVE